VVGDVRGDPVFEQLSALVLLVLVEFDHSEPAGNRVVEFVHRPVGHVHRTDDVHPLVQLDGLALVGLEDGLMGVLDGGVQRAEDLRDVGSRDLVEDDAVLDVESAGTLNGFGHAAEFRSVT